MRLTDAYERVRNQELPTQGEQLRDVTHRFETLLEALANANSMAQVRSAAANARRSQRTRQ